MLKISIINYLFLIYLATLSTSMNFRLTRNKQVCIKIPTPNVYNFEFSVTGESPQLINCTIYYTASQQTIPITQQISYKSSYQTTLNITNQQSRICFHSLDSFYKIVSFDIIPMNDPMRAQIIQKDMNQLYTKMEMIYINMQKLYRNQHFYYERNRGHRDRLANLQNKIKIMKGFKIGLIILAGLGQYFLIKKILDKKDKKSSMPYQQIPVNSI